MMRRALSPVSVVVSTLALMAAVLSGSSSAQELVEIKVDSKARKYSEKNPLQAAKQEFSLSKAGLVKLVYKTNMIYKDARGGFIVEEANLSNYSIGMGIYQKRIPDAATPGQPYTFEQHWICPDRAKPLNLRGALAALHFPQSTDQLASNQVLSIRFVPYDKISAEPGPAAEVDVTGKWIHGEENATLTFTSTGAPGQYNVVEKGYDNMQGAATVKGRTIYIDWVTTTAKGAKQKKGTTVVEIQADGSHAEGWWVGEHGTGGERWTALAGTKAQPIKASPPQATNGRPIKWDYRVMDLSKEEVFGDRLQKTLNELGEQGWEVVNLLPQTGNNVSTVRVVLKRPKP